MSRKFSVDTCRRSLESFIDKAGHNKFFPGGKAPTNIVSGAPQMLDEWLQWSKNLKIFTEQDAEKYALEVLNLALYDIHVLVDDSGSITEGNRADSILGSVNMTVHVQNIFRTGGVWLHYIHGNDPTTPFTTSKALDPQLKEVRYGGPSNLGTTVNQKIWPKILESFDFKKPCLVYLLTDGEPTGEPEQRLAYALQECAEKLTGKGYKPTAIAFQLMQIGDDFGTRDFLQKQLVQNDPLNDHVDVMMEDTDLENAYRTRANLPKQAQDTLTLRLFVGAINRPLIGV